jgi:hypothetical protein
MTTMTAPIENEEGLIPPDDLEDPATPMQALADQTQLRVEDPIVNPNTVEGQAILSVDEAMFKITQHAATCLGAIDKSWDAALRVLNQGNNGLLALKEALQNWAPHTPYRATVQVVTPAGFPMSLSVEALTQRDFLEKVGALMQFLSANGFTVPR